MERSLGIERTIRPKDYEAVKASSYVSGIPLQSWEDPQFVKNLYKLLTVQAYKAFMFEGMLVGELRELDNTEDRLAYLIAQEISLVETLDLHELTIDTKIEE